MRRKLFEGWESLEDSGRLWRWAASYRGRKERGEKGIGDNNLKDPIFSRLAGVSLSHFINKNTIYDELTGPSV